MNSDKSKRNGRGGKREGAGRPAIHGEPMRTFSVTLPLPMLAQIDREAKAAKVSRSEIVRRRLATSAPS